MPKRRADPQERRKFEGESSSDEDVDMVDVEFEFFDPQEIDFQGIKSLTRQLFDVDAELFDLSGLADLILSQPKLGSTIKTDGQESDPFAFLTVLNLKEHAEKPVVKTLLDYILAQAKANGDLSQIADILNSSQSQIGLLLTERLVNMPVQVVPAMYNMLEEEIQWAIEENEPYKFTHYLILSKTYQEVESVLDQEDNRPKKKTKSSGAAETFYFHPEDEVIHRFALTFGNYAYQKLADEGAADSRRAFQELGIRPQGHMMLMEASKYTDMVKAMLEFVSE